MQFMICRTTHHVPGAHIISTIGLITYHYPHLKTEQVLQRLLAITPKLDLRMYALPFTPHKARDLLFHHRPEQVDAVAPEVMAAKHAIPYIRCTSDGDIDDSCDFHLVLGAGLLSPQCVAGKRIINCHPGIIPSSRGLDSFKWAIHEMKPLGITLHYIDAEVDAGEIIAVVPTNVYASDSLATLARRHYENEIDVLSRFLHFLEHPQNPCPDITPCEPRRRIPIEYERELARQFTEYTAQFGGAP